LFAIANALYWILFRSSLVAYAISIPVLLTLLFFLILLSGKGEQYILVMAIAFIFADLSLNPVNYDDRSSPLYPPVFYARNRFFSRLEADYGLYRVRFDVNLDSFRRNIGDVYRIQCTQGFGATYYMPYHDFTTKAPLEDRDRFLNVRYVVTDKRLDSGYVLKDSMRHLRLYERADHYPRVYWAGQVGERGADMIREDSASIRLLAYSDMSQRYEVECSKSDTLVFSENYYPGWSCYDNGKKVPVVARSVEGYAPLFRSVLVEKGHHVIEFRYAKAFYWF
jgi:hypothetical protein